MNRTTTATAVATLPVRETIDLSNAIRGDIRTQIRKLHQAGRLYRGGEGITINITTLPSVDEYLSSDPTNTGDTRSARISHLRTYAQKYVFGEFDGYVGAAVPEKGIPFVYRLTYVEAVSDWSVCGVLITPLRTPVLT